MTAMTYIHKIEKIGEIAKDSGWEIKYSIKDHEDVNQIEWKLRCVRKPEAMSITYTGNRLSDALYILGDKAISPPHKAAVIKILTGHPDLTRVGVHAAMSAKGNLPFDAQETPAREILDMLLSRQISWVSSLTTEIESERIDMARNKGSKYYRIIRLTDGRRYLEFISTNAFRAVYLDAIVSVN